MTDLAATDPLPKPKRDLAPILLPIALALLMIPLIGSTSSWLTLTAASLAMSSHLPARHDSFLKSLDLNQCDIALPTIVGVVLEAAYPGGRR